MDVGLSNHIKNQVCDFYLYTIYFKYFNYIVSLLCLIELIAIFIVINKHIIHSPSCVIVVLILE